MTPGERAARRVRIMRGLAKLDGVTTYDTGYGIRVQCRYKRTPRDGVLHTEYLWRVRRGVLPWKKIGATPVIDLLRELYEVDDGQI